MREGMRAQLAYPAHVLAQIVKNRQLEASVHAQLRPGITAGSCFLATSLLFIVHEPQSRRRVEQRILM